jgi:cyanophycin synthetase
MADLDQPREEQGRFWIDAVEARPSLAPFLAPRCDRPQPVGEAIVGLLFPEGAAARIPLAGVVGGPVRAEVASLLHRLLEPSFSAAGLAVDGSVTVKGRSWRVRNASAFEAARSLLMHPEAAAAVIAVGRGDVFQEGLGFDRCLVAIIAGLDDRAELQPANWGFEEPSEDLPRAERCLAEVVLPGGTVVLDADDGRLESIVDFLPEGAGLTLTASDPRNGWVARHGASGGRSVVLEGSRAVFREGLVSRGEAVVDRLAHEPRTVLCALAGGWAMGVSPRELGVRLSERR